MCMYVYEQKLSKGTTVDGIRKEQKGILFYKKKRKENTMKFFCVVENDEMFLSIRN